MRTMSSIRQPKARTSGKQIEEKIRDRRGGNAAATFSSLVIKVCAARS